MVERPAVALRGYVHVYHWKLETEDAGFFSHARIRANAPSTSVHNVSALHHPECYWIWRLPGVIDLAPHPPSLAGV
jgi:hypothetical protein